MKRTKVLFQGPALAAATLLCVFSGCTCNNGIKQSEGDFRPDPTAVDFGRVLEDHDATFMLSVIGTGTAEVQVDITVEGPTLVAPPPDAGGGPGGSDGGDDDGGTDGGVDGGTDGGMVTPEKGSFSAPTTVTVAGGGTTLVPIAFHAGNAEVTGELRLQLHGSDLTPQKVTLHAVGVHPKTCIPSAPCIDSSYSLSLDTCVESPSAEDAICTPTSLCLDNGRCHNGSCLGTARSCEDGDPCTDNSCSEEFGCQMSEHVCPSPNQLCKVAICNSSSGCGVTNAPDMTGCGPIDCHSGSFCVAGACITLPTPDGFICAGPTPCQDQSACHGGFCVSPDPVEMSPVLTVHLDGTPASPIRPALLAFNGNLYLPLCGVPRPSLDGGDGGDDGGLDAGSTDAGAPADGGTGCVLESYTGNGFLRWSTWLASDTVQLSQVGPQGALVLEQNQAELISLGSGAASAYSVATLLGGQATEADGTLTLTAAAGGLLTLATDGGLSDAGLDAGAPPIGLVAYDETQVLTVYDPVTGRLVRWPSADGGVTDVVIDAGEKTLLSSSKTVFAGHRTLIDRDGLGHTLRWDDDAGTDFEILPRPAMMGANRLIVFHQQCDPANPGCAADGKNIVARGFSLDDATPLWSARISDGGTFGRVEEASLALDLTDVFGVVLQESLDGGTQTFLNGYVGADRGLQCPMPQAMQLSGALFTGTTLWLLANHGGGWVLDSYSLGSFTASVHGWPVSDAISGQRRAK